MFHYPELSDRSQPFFLKLSIFCMGKRIKCMRLQVQLGAQKSMLMLQVISSALSHQRQASQVHREVARHEATSIPDRI